MNTVNSKNFRFMIAFVIVLLLVSSIIFVSSFDRSSIYTKIFDIESE